MKPNKIKVKSTPSTKRAWNDFATPRKNNATQAETFIFKNGTFTGKNKGVIFVLDKELTLQYQKEKQKSEN